MLEVKLLEKSKKLAIWDDNKNDYILTDKNIVSLKVKENGVVVKTESKMDKNNYDYYVFNLYGKFLLKSLYEDYDYNEDKFIDMSNKHVIEITSFMENKNFGENKCPRFNYVKELYTYDGALVKVLDNDITCIDSNDEKLAFKKNKYNAKSKFKNRVIIVDKKTGKRILSDSKNKELEK